MDNGSRDIVVRGEGKMVSNDTWNTLYKQAAEIIKSGFLPSAIKNPAQAIAVVLTGRELGIGMMEAFRGIHIIDNKPSIAPQLMMSLIYNSGVIQDLKINSQPDFCEVEGNRKGMSPVKVKFSEQDAKDLNLLWKDNWKKQKQNMLRWRAISAWARLVCPDVIGGLYTPEEIKTDEYQDSIEAAGEAVKLSEKLNSNPEDYDRWAEDIKVKILDDIIACTSAQQLSHVKKQYAQDISRLMDDDRIYIQEELDGTFQRLVTEEAEPEIQEDGSVVDRKTGQEVGLGDKVPPEAQRMPKKALFDAALTPEEQETYGKKWLPEAIAGIDACPTTAALTVWKGKNAGNRAKMEQTQRDYLDAYLKNAFTKKAAR